MSLCKRRGCRSPAKKDYCSDACRAAAWRDRRIPRCPNCGQPLPLLVSFDGGPPQRVLGPPPDDDMQRSERQHRRREA